MTTPTVALPGDAGSADCARFSGTRNSRSLCISHHSLHRIDRADAFTQTVTYAAPADDHITPDPAVFTAFAPPPAATRAATSAPSPVVSPPESTRSILGPPSGLEQVRVQEIPEIQIPERI